MAYCPDFVAEEPRRADVDASPGLLVVEFGVPWCPHCRAAQPFIAEALADDAALRHVKVEDGPGRVLGRSFRVKLWPTLIVLRDGREIGRVVRPLDAQVIRQALSGVS